MRIRLALAFLLAAVVPLPASATFHLWQIAEVYSSPDGRVQYVELVALASGQQFIAGKVLAARRGNETRTFTFPANLPGDSATTTGSGGIYGGETTTDFKSFLVATQGFADLDIVRPDYIVPNGFLFAGPASVNFADVDVFDYAALPAGEALYRGGVAFPGTPLNFAGITGTLPAQAPGPANHSGMWWRGPVENGWGMSIQQHGNVQFNAIYVYDAAGRPAWYVMPGGTWDAAFTRYTGPVYQPQSTPLDAYAAAQFAPGAARGTATLTFTGTTALTLQLTVDGTSIEKPLVRQAFGSGTAPITVGDMWWGGPQQDGWGVNLVQEGAIVFAVWYTYGRDGRGTWFVLPTGTWSGTTYSGTMYATTASAWLGVPYRADQLVVTPVGTLSFEFAGSGNATLRYAFTAGPFAGVSQGKAIVRQPY